MCQALQLLQVVNWFDTQRRKRTRLGLPFTAPVPSANSKPPAVAIREPPRQPSLGDSSMQATQSSSLPGPELLSKDKGETRIFSEAEESLLREIGISSPAVDEKSADAVISLTDDDDEDDQHLRKRLASSPEVAAVPDKPLKLVQALTGEGQQGLVSSSKEEIAEANKENRMKEAEKLATLQEAPVVQDATAVTEVLDSKEQQDLQKSAFISRTPQASFRPPQVTSAVCEAQQPLSLQTPQAAPQVEATSTGHEPVLSMHPLQNEQVSAPEEEAALALEGKLQEQSSVQFPAPSTHTEWSAEWLSQQAAHFKAISEKAVQALKDLPPLQPVPGQALGTLSKTEVCLQDDNQHAPRNPSKGGFQSQPQAASAHI